ncbi:MAG: preprotein translocase subunit SecG [Kiritimatiellales bacterium]|nr:preprotein translocase subunit SecG [Pontiella sp.]NNJ69828.1 preprotein translocase subunit SecG [Kiritimatiellales bacterium]
MVFIKALLIVVLTLCCLLLIGLILLQKSKSEGLGLAFGAGAGESLFGARAGNVLSKATVTLGVVFMACALILGVLFAQKDATIMDGVGSAPVQAPAVQAQPIEGLDLGVPVPEPAAVVEVPVADEM